MSEHDDRFTQAYERMLDRSKEVLSEAGHTMQKAVQAAMETASELGELTREEAERIGTYLKRDLHDAAEYLAENGGELRDWLRFDVEQVEDRILESLSLLVDQTKVDLNDLAQQAEAFGEWHTGEVTGPGTLVCDACGEELHFKQAGHIPPCPKCRGTVYKRG
jgi:NADH pyrophosphatase NudC (nudix superfamily)